MRELRKETETLSLVYLFCVLQKIRIRNERTPKGDGNLVILIIILNLRIHNKKWENSERRRKLVHIHMQLIYYYYLIRNERTPKGDGNVFSSSFISEKLNINKKWVNSERRRKPKIHSYLLMHRIKFDNKK